MGTPRDLAEILLGGMIILIPSFPFVMFLFFPHHQSIQPSRTNRTLDRMTTECPKA